MILDSFSLIDELDSRLTQLKIDPADFTLDHVAYRTASLSEYQTLSPVLALEAQKINETMVSGRLLGVFQLNPPVIYRQHKILAEELVVPKAGEVCQSRWEHVEYVVNCSLPEFVSKYSQIEFDQASIDHPEFPKVSIRFPDGLSAKFHTSTILDETNNRKVTS